MDDFYTIMGDFYNKGTMNKHASPTKRLIDQKNSCWAHKEIIKDNMRASQSYKMHYTTSPDKSYVIEPKGGELDYDLADKNPLKFYDQVMSQDIIQHKVKKATEQTGHDQAGYSLTTKVTKRKIGRILYAVQSKICEMVKEQCQHLTENDALLVQAMDDPSVRSAIYDNLRRENIKLVHKDSNEPVFRKQTTLLGEKGDDALEEQHEEEGEAIEPHEAGLHVEPKALDEINRQVQAFISKNKGMR